MSPPNAAPRRTIAPITVLQSLPRIRETTNPYLVQLVGAMPPAVETSFFSWRRAIFGGHDVVHMHWPELLLRGRGPARTAARWVLFTCVLIVSTVRRTAVVRTMHNVEPHEPGPRVERLLLNRVGALTSGWVRLNRSTPTPAHGVVSTIPHGHYRAWFSSHPRATAVSGTVLTYGLLRPYKGVERLIEQFAGVEGEAGLRIVGRPSDAALTESLRSSAEGDRRVSLRLDYVDDATLALEISAAQLVVLPYRDLHNSGALLLALSLDRPVLVPENPVTVALREEVGHDWVITFGGELTAAVLQDALDRTRTAPSAAPDLSAREWDVAGHRHEELYRAAIAYAHRSTTRRRP